MGSGAVRARAGEDEGGAHDGEQQREGAVGVGRSLSHSAAPVAIRIGAEQMANNAVSATPVRGTAQK